MRQGRRSFVALLGGAAALPLVARAQQTRPIIGFLRSTSPDYAPHFIASFRQGLRQAGYIDGENVAIEFRDADNQYQRLPELAADLIRRQVSVIVATGAVSAPLAAKAATTAVPIVFVIGSDPVQHGLVGSLNRPGGNVTGVTFFGGALIAKRLELVREVLPHLKAIGFLVNPGNPNATPESEELAVLARKEGLTLTITPMRDESELAAAMATFARSRIDAFLYSTDAFFSNNLGRIAALARQHAIPGMHSRRDAVAAGGLLSYGADPADVYRLAAIYVGKILKGAKPADLPVQLPTRFELVINLKTAKTLGINIPPTLFALADEVIE